MHLWIDGQCLQTGSRLRGIGRYLRELIRAVGEFHPGVRMSISFNAALPDAAIAARGSVAPWIAPGDVHVWQGLWHKGECGEGYSANYRLNEIALAHHVACLAPDIALSASPFEGQYDPVTPLFRGAGHAIPRAAIFYDAIPHRYPERYLKKKIEARCFARRLAAHRDFDLLLAISDFARREADDLVPGVPAVAIDAGTSPDFLALTRQATDPGILARLGLRKPFLLYVGGIDWRKNLDGVSQAFALLPPALRQTLQFVIAGDPSPRWFAKFRAAWQAAGLDTANLTALGHVSDENLVQLYKQTDLAIQPSRMEGFGLTALEAMVCGAPVIAANAGALPEVVGDPRALFDPLNPKAMSERIAQFLSDRALTQSLVTQGLERASRFSWERTARLAVEALKSIAKAPPAQSADTLRRITFAHLGSPDPAMAADILAAAEPPASGPARLLIDVTFTTFENLGTGIQRVVGNIARGMSQKPDNQLFWCEKPEGFNRATVDAAGTLKRLPATPENHIVPRRGDHILMLDSSWIYAPIYNRVMRRARLQGCDITSVLYDLTPLKLPAFCVPEMPEAFGTWLQSALLYSTGFVCISKAVADELLALLEVIRFPRVMKVGYWRLGAIPAGNDSAVLATDPAAPTFLMVSTLEPRKGYRVALDAFTQLWREGFGGRLCIIGRRGWGVEHLAADLKAHPEWNKKLFWLEDADDQTLQMHYATCVALISSSYAEGFGLPIVEAAQHGKPVIASDIPVFREVAGEGAGVRYFPVGSADGLAAAVREFLARHDETPLVRLGQPVSWEQSAAALEEILTGDHWYRIYRPLHPTPDVALDNVGTLTAPPPQTEAQRRHCLELVEGPYRAGQKLKFVVRVTNLSESLWSGAGDDGVALGIRPAGRRKVKSWFSRIPLVQSPGETLTMSVEIPVKDAAGLADVEIALAQGQDWWDGGLRVPLNGRRN